MNPENREEHETLVEIEEAQECPTCGRDKDDPRDTRGCPDCMNEDGDDR